MPLPLFAAKKSVEIVLQVLTVRIHTGISRNSWSRLWYLCRAFDGEGRGCITLPLEFVAALLDCNEKSVYRWLDKGRRVGAFRRYKVRRGLISVWMGSLFVVCYNLNLKVWGAVGVVPLAKVITLAGLRATTTGVVTEKFQQKSRYAANINLKPEYRKLYGAPHPSELFAGVGGQSSHQTGAGQLPPNVLHISPTRIWTSKNFTHYGASQHSISCELGIHKRTVQRHQQQLGMERRQVCQKRQAYTWLKQAIEHETQEYYLDAVMLKAAGTGSDAGAQCIGYTQFGETVVFTDGIPLGAKKQTPNNKWEVPAGEFQQRFFQMGNDTWMSRCNIYRETQQLTTMRAAKRKYRFHLAKLGFYDCHSDSEQKNPPVVQATILT